MLYVQFLLRKKIINHYYSSNKKLTYYDSQFTRIQQQVHEHADEIRRAAKYIHNYNGQRELDRFHFGAREIFGTMLTQLGDIIVVVVVV